MPACETRMYMYIHIYSNCFLKIQLFHKHSCVNAAWENGHGSDPYGLHCMHLTNMQFLEFLHYDVMYIVRNKTPKKLLL